jgi:predicted  nucleic acid-binding Zn-ribbon protein
MRDDANFARQLERELVAAESARDEARRMISEINDENELLRAELAAMEKQRDEARENLRDACKESAIRVNTHAMSMMELENEFSARVTMAFVAAMRKGEQDGN